MILIFFNIIQEKMSIYVATQKKVPYELPKGYIPIFVGALLNENWKSLNYVTDDTGDNISEKNKTFCELTALYWMWKNSSEDIIGLAHYRRFLSKNWIRRDCNNIISIDEAGTLLNEFDLILPKKSCLWGTVENQYSNGQHSKDYKLCGEILKEKYPDYYDDFVAVSQSDAIYICNIFIGRKSIIDSYCEWLFSILFELENKVDLTDYSVSEKRIFGYLSERLFNVWIRHNKLNVKELYLLNTEMKLTRQLISAIHTFNYKVLGIDVMKYSAKRVARRKRK